MGSGEGHLGGHGGDSLGKEVGTGRLPRKGMGHTSAEVLPLVWGAGPHAQMVTQAHRCPTEGSPRTHVLPLRLLCSRFIRLLFFFFSCAVANPQLTSRSACPSGQHRTQ